MDDEETVTKLAPLLFICLAGSVAAQQPEAPPPDVSAASQTEEPIPLTRLVTGTLRDQKAIWTFPARVGQHWKPVLAVAAVTAGLIASDPYTESYFHDRAGFSTYKTGPLRGRNSTLAMTLTPAAFFVVGLTTKRAHSRNTGLLAAEAVVDTQIVTFAMKHAIGRLTPSEIPPQGSLRDTWFKYHGSFTNGGSFPSGHSATAFGVATVIAVRYREHRWVPWVAYGVAAALALTRLPDQAHFPSDIFIGAAMGYGIGHLVMGRQ